MTFPTVQLPGVTDEARAELARIHTNHNLTRRVRLAWLSALMHKAQRGPLYMGTVPGHVKAQRRKAGKAQRAARKVAR